MNGIIYERATSPNRSAIGRDNYLVVTKKVSLKHRIFLSPFVKYVLPISIVVTCLMAGVYLTMYFTLNKSMDVWESTCNIRESYRVECFPGRTDISYDRCNEADCCWHDETSFCFHSIPSRHGYKPENNQKSYRDNDVFVPRKETSPFGKKNVESLTLNVKKYSDPNHIEIIFKIGTMESREKKIIEKQRETVKNSSFEEGNYAKVPDVLSEELLNFLPKDSKRSSINLQTDPESVLDVYVHKPEFSVTVTRKDEPSSLLSTARGPLILTENFWELTLYITNSSLYGINQLELNGTISWIYDNENSTSRLAFLGIDNKGQAAACYINHKGPVEVKVINESNLIILRGLSLPRELSIHVFNGPTPLDAIRQLTKSIEQNDEKNDDIELSSLGLHVCPDDDSQEYVESLSTIIDNMKQFEAPWDSHCIHRDFDSTLANSMTDENFSILQSFIKRLSEETEERKISPHLTPMLYQNSLASKLISDNLVLTNGMEPYMGLYRTKDVVYPDWNEAKTHSESITYLKNYTSIFGNSKLVFIRDSWPMNKRQGNPIPNASSFDYIPRVLQKLMVNGTVPYDLTTPSRMKSHYTEHGSYSSDFLNFAKKNGDSKFLVIRGHRSESGNSSWSALKEVIRAGVGSGIVGQLPSPMYACGTGRQLGSGENNDQLCSRWYGASVAWPHVLALYTNLPNGEHLSTSSSTYVTKHLRLRSSLLTYANTILARYYMEGSPILAPTSIYYSQDLQARNRWNQFMWGDGILVGLVTLPGVSQVEMWIPGKYPWRHLTSGVQVYPTKVGITSITAVERDIVTLIRPGSIIPIHEKISMTSASTIKNDLTLVANLACDENECNAEGKIFYNSDAGGGEFLYLTTNRSILTINNILNVQTIACSNNEMEILRQGTKISKVLIDGSDVQEINFNFCTVKNNFTEIPYDKV